MKKIILAKSAGFCFGVKRAVDTVYEHIETDDNLYTYGPIIHNESVVEDMEDKGVRIIDNLSELKDKKTGTLIIRSHGISEKEYKELEGSAVNVVDATCPFVLKIHRIVEEASNAGKQIVIIGDANHPEVKGIIGWCRTPAIVINTVEEAEAFESENKDIHIVSQTTFQSAKFNQLVEIIQRKGYNGNISNTICSATEIRQKEAEEIAREVDAMIIVGGRNSSNTRKLYDISKKECPNTYLIQRAEDLDWVKLKGAESIGITAGASTPNNIIQEVYISVRAEF